jgi:1,4-alpha-glucan branching enzyme
VVEHNGVVGTYFAVWAPNAQYVSVIGNFNGWNKGSHTFVTAGMASGIWEGFIPMLALAKFINIISNHLQARIWKKQTRLPCAGKYRLNTASIVADTFYEWKDQTGWPTASITALDKPYSVYEVHLGSWARSPESPDEFLTYRQLGRYFGALC